MASKNSKGAESKGKKVPQKSNNKDTSESAAIANLQKLLDKASAENKKLSDSYNLLLKDNKALKHSVKEVEIERNSLRKQSSSFQKKEQQSQDKISKLQNDVLSSKNELSRVKKEKDDRLSFEKQDLNDKFKELKRKEKELERERSAVEKEIGILRKLKEDTKSSASAIAKSVSKMSNIDSEYEVPAPEVSKKRDYDSSSRDTSYLEELDKIFEKFAVVLTNALQSAPTASGEQPPITASLNLDGLGEILENFAALLKDNTQAMSNNIDSAPRDTSYLGELDKIFDKFAVVLTDAMQNMPAAQVTAIPITQLSTTADPTTPESTKMMESLSSYLDKATENIKLAPPQVVISPQTVAPPQIEGLTSASERDPSAMISKPEEPKSYSDTPVMRMKLDKDDDMYEDRLVITYTFDNMPENRVYSKYKKILRNAVRITLLGNLQEGLELFNVIKNQNISDEYKSMIEKNISDITYYLRGCHRARLE